MRKKILFLGGDKYHPLEILFTFKEILKNLTFDLIFTEDLNVISKNNIKDFNLIVFSKSEILFKEEEIQTLKEAIIANPWENFKEPINFIGIHGAITSTDEKEHFNKMIGGKFLTHPEISNIKIYKEKSIYTKKIKNFMIYDELYLMEYFLPFVPLLYTFYEGFKLPLSWIKNYGRGKICYLSLGHSSITFENKHIINFIKNIIINFI